MNVDGSVLKKGSLRILITGDAVGGVWRYCVDLIRELDARGIEVVFATMGPRPSTAQKQDLCRLRGVSLIESDFALEWMKNPERDFAASGQWLLQLQAAFQADIIHLNSYSHAGLPWNKPVVVGAHSCVFSWWQGVHQEAPPSSWVQYEDGVREGLDACSAIIAPSSTMASSLCAHYAAAAAKIQVIHNFSQVRRTSTTSKHPLLLAAGRIWDPAKNLQMLDAIAPRLRWKLGVAGSHCGPDSACTEPMAVHLLGALSRSQMISRMSQAEIFVHPALYEPFGLSVLEAARCFCCLVLSDIPSLRELWDGAALFLNPRDPDQWVFELNRLSQDRDQRRSLARLASARARKYSAPSALKLYLSLYQSLGGGLPAIKKEAAA